MSITCTLLKSLFYGQIYSIFNKMLYYEVCIIIFLQYFTRVQCNLVVWQARLNLNSCKRKKLYNCSFVYNKKSQLKICLNDLIKKRILTFVRCDGKERLLFFCKREIQKNISYIDTRTLCDFFYCDVYRNFLSLP